MYKLRKATTADSEFIYETVKTTMRKFAIETWGVWLDKEARKDAEEGAKNGKIQIICVNNEKVGTVQVAITENEIILKQLYILPKFQYRGIGGEILRDLKVKSNKSNLPITLRVLQVNSAKEFYLKNGFTVEKETAERMFFRCAP